MKKLLTDVMALVLTISMVSCGDSQSDDGKDNDDSIIATPSKYSVEYDSEDIEKLPEGDVSSIVTQVEKIMEKISADDFAGFAEAINLQNYYNCLSDTGGHTYDELYAKYSDSFSDIVDECVDLDFSKEITQILVNDYDTDTGSGRNYWEVGFLFGSKNDGVAVLCYVVTNGNNYSVFIQEVEDHSGQKNTNVTVQTANSNAKLAYCAITTGVTKLETNGTYVADGSYQYDLSENNEDGTILEDLGVAFSNVENKGIVYYEISNNEIAIVQWRASSDSDAIGQYPNPPTESGTVSWSGH